ncbi:MAG: tRNA 5-methoxyuridine(34)/uridine 5-oxyacetic acid(34) synthase CmoB [Desulfobulbus sp.]|jgi:tRNA (mo5U34)-methyltransferase|nr:tRNA 5-methoxyuridine(34)/uridine 5-oxyacetic acid(34) synthase CmoB [Desulfobulbus sp.]
MDLCERFPLADRDELRRILETKTAWVGQAKKGFLRFREPWQSIRHLRATSCDFSGDVVRIGSPADLTPPEQQQVHNVLRAFMPWRKGPFSVFGIDIDAEWRSEKKWNRILPELPELAGRVVADIGSNNGYYMFRMAAHRPSFVLGFEPYVQHYYTFRTLNSFADLNALHTELLGIEHLPLFPGCFDVIFCLGILYHRPSPLETLRDLHAALVPGGQLILESQAIPAKEPVALFPERTYAKVPGTWFVPSASCLRNWLTRSGFRAVRLFCEHAMSDSEQRRTDWMQYESYEDFIDKDNPLYTVEGYPAPRRVFFSAEK